MIFLADIFVFGGECNNPQDKSVDVVPKTKYKLKKNKKQKVNGLTFSKLNEKTIGMANFSKGKIAVMQSLVKNDVKHPLDNNVKQKLKQHNVRKLKNYSSHKRGIK